MQIILTDCDGVLLDWNKLFVEWMAHKGFVEIQQGTYCISERYGIEKAQSRKFVREFNESAAIRYLKPFRDSMHYVRRLYEEHGYQLRVITSLSHDPWAIKAREENLKLIFGDAIESVICLETGADKDEALAPYKDSGLFWIEDKYENAVVGHELGLRTILIDHDHNESAEEYVNGKYIWRAHTWADVYVAVTSNINRLK